MSLDRQIHIYSFDTSAFYTDEEKELETATNQLIYRKNALKDEKEILSALLGGKLSVKKAESQYRALYRIKQTEPITMGGHDRIKEIEAELKELNAGIKAGKDAIKSTLGAHNEMRQLRPECVIDKNVISVFESMLTRTLGMETGKLHDDLIIVRAYYFDVIRDLILNGFTYNGEKYICFTASAGQIRTKKVVFIKESAWNSCKETLMCGLSIEEINKKGGININKYLAYLALCNSATDVWADFDINKSIVVDDMETLVKGTVDFIDHHTYSIERREMEVPITHTDGCGMVLPQRNRKNTMVRLPWVKGLLAVFPFDKFIREANEREPEINHGLVTDIYGVQHDVIAEQIEVIFTKSQFKMWKYYDSWEDYIKRYKRCGCSAGKCNEEEDYIPNSHLNYQILQTLTDISTDELSALAEKTVDKINRIASDRDTMLIVFGASPQKTDKNAFQEALSIYPELLSDSYTKDILRQIKKSLVKNARAGKLDIDGKYLFLIPDLYAFCEWLFLGDRNPAGLLRDGEVSCYLYRRTDKLDCLRSPHLYREHAVRRNVVSLSTLKWFSKGAIYTSCHDLISKILQFDCDGDKSLVCADQLLVSIAERNMSDIVPLYYEMAKAGAVQISSTAIYSGMRSAWKYGNIGVISNNITKIWNSGAPDLELIKIQTCENNFSIDAAKTLYMPERPDDVAARLDSATKAKVPHFFLYAKDKEGEQVEPTNESCVNRLEAIVPNKRLVFTAENIGKLNYKYMLSKMRSKVALDPAIIDLYEEMEQKYRYSLNFSENNEEMNVAYIRSTILSFFIERGYDLERVTDMLVKYLFTMRESKRKTVFWLCFGDIVVRNLKRNVPQDTILCKKCGERFRPTAPQQKLCKDCSTYHKKGKKVLSCVECGTKFEVDARNMRKVRCDACQTEKTKERQRLYAAKRRVVYKQSAA